ncbi:hypothetical protein BZA70DRAFT_291081 [Myxozyma melibiosi]|uniref:Centrosomin N-terminal motif 1 domain-containing protein n=1 Tax=Myxozyma melibiosi TaxID=54550 RepID=A0ABR1F0V7_9ASCO
MVDLNSNPPSQLPRARTNSSSTSSSSLSPVKSQFSDSLANSGPEIFDNLHRHLADLSNLSSMSVIPPLSPPAEGGGEGMPAVPPTAATPQSVARLVREGGKRKSMMSPVSVADSVLDVAESLSRMSINSDGDKTQNAMAATRKDEGAERERQGEANAEYLASDAVEDYVSPSPRSGESQPQTEGEEEYVAEEEDDLQQEEDVHKDTANKVVHKELDEEQEYDDSQYERPEVDDKILNSSMAVSETMSLPSMETSFAGSLVQNESSVVAPGDYDDEDDGFEDDDDDDDGYSDVESPTVVRKATSQQMRAHEEFLSSPPVSPPPVSDQEAENQQRRLHDVAEEEVEEEEEYDSYDRSPLYQKGPQPTSKAPAQTPRPGQENRSGRARQHNPAPTNTAIADRVKNVKVTDSAIKSFALRQSSSGSMRSSIGHVPNTVSKLTLKEQSALIDKLQKETFGLQLKIYYMTQELDKRSEDGVREIRNENIELKSTVARMSLEAKSMQRQISELESKLIAAEQRSSRTTRDHAIDEQAEAERQLAVEELQNDMEQHLVMIEELRADADKSREQLNEMIMREREYLEEIDRLKKTQGNSDILEEQISTLKGFLEKEQEAHAAAQKEILDLRSDMLKVRRSTSVMGDRESSAEISRLRQEIRDLRRELGTQTMHADAQAMEKERLRRELDDLRRRSSSSRRSLVSSGELEENGIMISELRDKLSEVKHIARERKIQVDILNRENGELQDAIEAQQTNIQMLNRKVDELAEKMDAQEAELDQCYRDIQTREEEIVTWQEDYEALSTEAESELTRLNDLIKAKNEEISRFANVDDELLRLDDLVKSGEEQLAEREEALMRSKRELEEARASSKAKDVEFDKMNAEVESCTRLLSALQRDNAAQKKELGVYREQAAEQEQTIESLRAQIDELQQSLEARKSASHEQQQQQQKKLQSMKKQLEETRAAEKKLRKELADERAENAAARETLESVKAFQTEVVEQLEAKDLASEQEQKAIEHELARRDAEHAALVAELERKVEDAEARAQGSAEQVQRLMQESVASRASVRSTGSAGSSAASKFGDSLGSSTGSTVLASQGMTSDKFMLRLQDYEKRLKAEREARIRDRDGSRQRLGEAQHVIDELREQLSRARVRSPTSMGTFGMLPLGQAFGRTFAGGGGVSAGGERGDDIDDDVDG